MTSMSCGECPAFEDCRRVLDIDESTHLTNGCPIYEYLMIEYLIELINRIAKVITRALQDPPAR